MPVVFDGGTDNDFRRGVTVPLCTVAAGGAEDMMAKVYPRIVLSGGMRSGTLSYVANGDDTETIYVRFAAKGLVVSFR